MNIDTRELDRLLCERLGIEPITWEVRFAEPVGEPYRGHFCAGLRDVAKSLAERNSGTCEPIEYPAVSTDGNAMLVLIAALGKDGRWVKIAASSPEAGCRAEVLNRYLGVGPYCWNLSMPTAVALAAAAALGIAVPQKEQA